MFSFPEADHIYVGTSPEQNPATRQHHLWLFPIKTLQSNKPVNPLQQLGAKVTTAWGRGFQLAPRVGSELAAPSKGNSRAMNRIVFVNSQNNSLVPYKVATESTI